MNPLTVDKISKKFLYEKDSGFLVVRHIIEKMPKNWRFTILVPKDVKRNFFPESHIVDLVEYDYSTSIHQNRYHFNRNILAKLLPYGQDIDVVINNQPEVSMNIKTFFENQRREKPIIINFFHWIDCKESASFANELSGYIFRQIDGVMAGDISLFHGLYAKSLFDASVANTVQGMTYNSGFFYPKPTKFGEDEFQLPDKKIILFNHRLNNTSGWQKVFNICEKLARTRDDFVLWFTDEQNLKAKNKFDAHWVITKSIPFKSYGYLMKNSHFSICNTQGYATWNLAILDSIVNGCLPLVPNIPLYKSMLNHTGVYFNDLEEMIPTLLDNEREINQKMVGGMSLPSDETDIKKFIINEIQNRVKVSIAKYDEVRGYITDKKVCKKSDFINHFWSFHVNSNFQLIRWKLLSDGFVDNTRLSHTEWSATETLNLGQKIQVSEVKNDQSKRTSHWNISQ